MAAILSTASTAFVGGTARHLALPCRLAAPRVMQQPVFHHARTLANRTRPPRRCAEVSWRRTAPRRRRRRRRRRQRPPPVRRDPRPSPTARPRGEVARRPKKRARLTISTTADGEPHIILPDKILAELGFEQGQDPKRRGGQLPRSMNHTRGFKKLQTAICHSSGTSAFSLIRSMYARVRGGNSRPRTSESVRRCGK